MRGLPPRRPLARAASDLRGVLARPPRRPRVTAAGFLVGFMCHHPSTLIRRTRIPLIHTPG